MKTSMKFSRRMEFLIIPEKDVSEFKKLLVAFYEGESIDIISQFMRERCWKNFKIELSIINT